MTERGLFISFEGTDGCGKTTQKRLLTERLRQLGHSVVETVEPGGTAIGAQVRSILLDPSNSEMSAVAELLLYFSARAQNADECIRPALESGRMVLTDRFTDSTLAYQGYGRGLGEEVVLQLDSIACRGLKPDLTFLFDIDLETSLRRRSARNVLGSDRMDSQAAEFYERVRGGYLAIATREPERFAVIDGRPDVEAVAAAVWARIEPLLP